ncbi:hypothetical protein [Allohahella sp. A8]|uniref:hypothetical protein n=1 Tax=Allohahella sp. A8 TaxID=3141461 RepID=UPI003A7FA1B1
MTKGNPFKHRWQLESPEWVKQRKREWPSVKRNLEQSGVSVKAMKFFKAFYVEGVEPPNVVPGTFTRIDFYPKHRLFFTPSETEEEVREVFDSAFPSDYNSMLVSAAAGAAGLIADGNEFGYAGEQEKLIAHALFPKEHNEDDEVYWGKETWKKYIPAEEFVERFISRAYAFLVGTTGRNTEIVRHTYEHFLSSLRFLEHQGVSFHDHSLPALLSCLFNFVEPRAAIGEASPARLFAEKLQARLSDDDAPKSIQEAIVALGPNRVWEFPRHQVPEQLPLYPAQLLANEWTAPFPRALHGIEPLEALAALVQSAQRVGLLPANMIFPAPEQCNLRGWLNGGLVERMGFGLAEDVPAYRFRFWFSPTEHLSNRSDARLGLEVFLPVLPKGRAIDEITPTLIYYPRLSADYHEYFPSIVLLLKEREFRRALYTSTGKHLLFYHPEVSDEVYALEFSENPMLKLGYFMLEDMKSGSLELALESPEIAQWQGPSLPQADISRVYQDV